MVCYIVLIISTHKKLKIAKTILNNSRVYILCRHRMKTHLTFMP